MWLCFVVVLDPIIYPAHGGGERGYESRKALWRPSKVKIGDTTSCVCRSGYIYSHVDPGEVPDDFYVAWESFTGTDIHDDGISAGERQLT